MFDFFKIKTTWTNAELWLFKLTLFSGSALIGAYFSSAVLSLAKYFFIVFIVSTAWATYSWVRKMKKEK